MPMNGGGVIVIKRHSAALAKRAELRLDMRELFLRASSQSTIDCDDERSNR